MVAKRTLCPESQSIRDLFYKLSKMDGDESEKENEFRKDLKKIVQGEHCDYLYIAESLKKYAKRFRVDDTSLWRLADEVEPGIKQAWENSRKHPWGIPD